MQDEELTKHLQGYVHGDIINGEGKLGKTIFVVNPIYFCLWHVFCQKLHSG